MIQDDGLNHLYLERKEILGGIGIGRFNTFNNEWQASNSCVDSFHFYRLDYLDCIFPSMDDRVLSTAVVKLGALESTRWILGDLVAQMEVVGGVLGVFHARSRSVVVC